MTDEEKARKAVLAWITTAERLLGSAALMELASPRGRLHWRDAEIMNIRCKNLATKWDEKFSKIWHLLGITEAAAQRVSVYIHALETVVKHATTPKGRPFFTSVHVDETRDRVLVDLAKLSKLVAVAEDESRRNIWPQTRQGRPSAERISLEFLAERAKAGETLPHIGAEAKAIAPEVKKRIHREYINIPPPAPRTIEDHIREEFNALKS